jgi:hypothetical protein
MITILSSPKPWVRLSSKKPTRRNKKSWITLHPDVEIILYGDLSGTADAFERFRETLAQFSFFFCHYFGR